MKRRHLGELGCLLLPKKRKMLFRIFRLPVPVLKGLKIKIMVTTYSLSSLKKVWRCLRTKGCVEYVDLRGSVLSFFLSSSITFPLLFLNFSFYQNMNVLCSVSKSPVPCLTFPFLQVTQNNGSVCCVVTSLTSAAVGSGGAPRQNDVVKIFREWWPPGLSVTWDQKLR
jgi:hypothetical protein